MPKKVKLYSVKIGDQFNFEGSTKKYTAIKKDAGRTFKDLYLIYTDGVKEYRSNKLNKHVLVH